MLRVSPIPDPVTLIVEFDTWKPVEAIEMVLLLPADVRLSTLKVTVVPAVPRPSPLPPTKFKLLSERREIVDPFWSSSALVETAPESAKELRPVVLLLLAWSCSVAPLPTTVLLAVPPGLLELLPVRMVVPLLSVRAPVKILLAVSVLVPLPVKVRAPAPEITPVLVKV